MPSWLWAAPPRDLTLTLTLALTLTRHHRGGHLVRRARALLGELRRLHVPLAPPSEALLPGAPPPLLRPTPKPDPHPHPQPEDPDPHPDPDPNPDPDPGPELRSQALCRASSLASDHPSQALFLFSALIASLSVPMLVVDLLGDLYATTWWVPMADAGLQQWPG